MTYTIKTDRFVPHYVNEDHTESAVDTQEASTITVSLVDTPDLWTWLHDQCQPLAYVPPLTIKTDRFVPHYATADHTSVELDTQEVAALIISQADTPELWAWLHAQCQPADYVAPVAPPRSVAMWRARTIMKITPWGEGTLFDAVQQAIAGLTNPLQKASAEEALERGDIFDRDGMFVPVLAKIVGISEEQLDTLMQQAAGLPA